MQTSRVISATVVGLNVTAGAAYAQTVRDGKLSVRTIVAGLDAPSTMAFIGANDFLVTEKNTGRVQRVTGGVIAGTVLDLAVNFDSERGLLGIALHPQFPTNSGVYLYWTESTATGETDVLSETPLLGNRVDRFAWSGCGRDGRTPTCTPPRIRPARCVDRL